MLRLLLLFHGHGIFNRMTGCQHITTATSINYERRLIIKLDTATQIAYGDRDVHKNVFVKSFLHSSLSYYFMSGLFSVLLSRNFSH